MPLDETDTVQITRRVKASRERVFAAFGSIESLQQWLGPDDCGIIEGRMDFREGGSYFCHMKTPDGESDLMGTFHVIRPPERLVFTWHWVEQGAPETVVTVELKAIGEETEVHLTHSGFSSRESSGNHDYGWLCSFDRLNALLAS